MKILKFLLALILLTGLALTFWPKNQVSDGKLEIKIGEALILADVADTPARRELGLSGRESLGEREGLLFVFEATSTPGFWMKDMNFPIDIIWINAEKVVVGVEHSVKPESYPQVFRPKEPVLYVLELPAGSSVKWRIDSGTLVYWER